MTRSKHPPGGDIIVHIAYRTRDWQSALGEWIDNSLDASPDISAAEIEIVLKREYARIQDNGKGTANPRKLVQLGCREDHASTQSGRYGIGSKDCLLWIGKEHSTVHIDTTCDGIRRTMQCDWADYAVSGWELDDPTEEPSDSVGTVISVSPNRVKIPEGARWKSLLADLGYLYSPAINRGAKISLRGPGRNAQREILTGWRMPKFDGAILDQRIVVDGRAARVYCGVVAKGEENRRSGLTYFNGFRVVVPASDKGCGDFSCAQICGFVELLGGREKWQLTTNKDGIVEGDALYEAVEELLAPLLQRAENAESELSSRLFETSISNRLNAALGRRPAREPGSKRGTIDPKNTGRVQVNASKTRGSGSARDAARPLTIAHVRMGIDAGAGEVKGSTIVLNLDNPTVLAAFREHDVRSSTILASTLLCYEHCHSIGKTGLLRLDETTFSKALGQLLAADDLTLDGRMPTELRSVP